MVGFDRHATMPASSSSTLVGEVAEVSMTSRRSAYDGVAPHRPGQVEAVAVGHRHVEQHAVERVAGPHRRGERHLGLVGADHCLGADPPPRQLLLEDQPVVLVVVDDQHPPTGQPAAGVLVVGVDARTRGLAEVRGEPEDGAAAGVGLEPDLAAQRVDDLARDRQPEPGAAVPARGRGVGLGERLEEVVDLRGVDPDPGVGDAHAEPGAPAFAGLPRSRGCRPRPPR